jgi:hypothetical protein
MEKRKRKSTFLISSKSSLKASETEAIQNCRNRSFIACSFSPFELPGAPWEGRKEGRSAGGGEGEGDKCLKVLGIAASAAFGWVFVFADRDASELEEESDESESESESESELDCLGSDVVGCADSLLEDESDSEEEEDSELETAALLFRFLVLFLGSGGIQVRGARI